MSELPWLIYALGSGWGHLNRALALARKAAQHRSVQLLTNSPYVAKIEPQLKIPNLELHCLPRLSLSQTRAAVHDCLSTETYSCLIVDTFPRGLLGELAALIPTQTQVCHVLVHRDLSPDYIAAKSVTAFVQQHYHQILIPGEPTAVWRHLIQAQLTLPWLSLSSTELSEPKDLRSRFRLSQDSPLLLICAAGQPEEQAFFGGLAQQLAEAFPSAQVRCLAPSCPPGCPPEGWIDHWPGIEVFQLAQVVLGSGGYNTVYECAALGIPLVAFAQPRRYDRQALRLTYSGYPVETVGAAIATIGPLLSCAPLMQTAPSYTNGAERAVSLIEQQLADFERDR